MADIDQQLVRAIADEVMRALRQKRDDAPPSAMIQAPIGVCTGDYSKFPELQQRHVGAAAPTTTPAEPAKPQTPALTGIITADQLRDAIKAAADGVAVLAADARLTPLANDLAREQPDKVRRLSATTSRDSSAATPWLWWSDGHCPTVAKLTHELRDRLRPTATARHGRGLLQVVREAARGVKADELSGAVLFVERAALAVCYANRCRSLRAVVGTHEAAVEEGLRDLGANVLIVEYPRVKGDVIEAMVRRFVAEPPRLPQQTQRDLRDLEAC